jgi:hypothetical protein
VFRLQLADAQVQYQQLQQQFEELKGDFQYNLQLLAERDAELQHADAAAASAAAELAAKGNTITQLQSQLTQAQSGECVSVLTVSTAFSTKVFFLSLMQHPGYICRTALTASAALTKPYVHILIVWMTPVQKLRLTQMLLVCLTDMRVERQRTADAATGFSHKVQQLQQQLDQERSSKAAALLEQQEQLQQQKHQLQALLAEAEDHLERQRRELSAGFLLQAQQIEAKHAAAAADARAEAATAAASAQAKAAEAAAAHEQALEHLKQAEVCAAGGCAFRLS